MGYETGRYVDLNGVERHVEASGGAVNLYTQGGELGLTIRLAPDQARRLADALALAASYFDGGDPCMEA